MGSCARLELHDLCIKMALKLERKLAQLKHANLQGEQRECESVAYLQRGCLK